MDLVLARAGVGGGLERAAHAVEVRLQQRGVARVEPARVEADAREVGLARREREAGGGRARVLDQREPLGRPGAVGSPVDLVRGHVHRLVHRQLDHLQVAGAGERAHQQAQERHQDQQQRQHEVAEDLELDTGARAARRCASRPARSARGPRGAPRGRRTSRAGMPSSLKNAATVCASGAARPVGGLHQVQHEAGGLLAVVRPDAIPGGVADQDHVERDLHLAARARPSCGSEGARSPRPAARRGPVLGVGVDDGVGDEQDDSNSVPFG